MSARLLVILWSIWGALSLSALIFIIARPTTWGSLVDRENDFWVRRGWLSPALAEKIKSLEKGFVLKLILAALALISAVVVCTLLRPQPQRPFKAMPPPVAPIQRRQPGN